jgi:hypothetical protein
MKARFLADNDLKRAIVEGRRSISRPVRWKASTIWLVLRVAASQGRRLITHD